MAIRKEFWRLAWPAAAEGLLLMLLTAADLLMVSALGNTAVAAVSIFSQPRMVILCVTRSYSVALSAYVARRRGKHPDESLTSCSRASLMLGCGLSMLLLVGTWIGAGPLLRLAGAQDDYINLGLQYAFPTLVSLALSGPAIVLHGILAGLGDMKNLLVRLGPKAPRYYVQIMAFILIVTYMITPALAVEDMWTAANRIIVDVYNKIAGISTVLAGLMSAVAVIGAKVSNNQHKTDQAWDWLKRIWIAWAIINGMGAFLAYVRPLFDSLATIQ